MLEYEQNEQFPIMFQKLAYFEQSERVGKSNHLLVCVYVWRVDRVWNVWLAGCACVCIWVQAVQSKRLLRPSGATDHAAEVLRTNQITPLTWNEAISTKVFDQESERWGEPEWTRPLPQH